MKDRLPSKRQNGAPAYRFVWLAGALLLGGCQSLTGSRVSVDYYQIQGNSTASLDREIRKKGPLIDGGQHAVAVARIKMIPNVKFTRLDGKCSVSFAKIDVKAKVTLPEWKGRKTANRKLGQTWDNIERYTRMHEAVHVAMAFEFAKAIEVHLKTLQNLENCILARQQAQTIVAAALKEHDAAQKQFDVDEQARLTSLGKRREENSG